MSATANEVGDFFQTAALSCVHVIHIEAELDDADIVVMVQAEQKEAMATLRPDIHGSFEALLVRLTEAQETGAKRQ